MARKFSLKASRLKLQASRRSGGDGRESSWNQQLRGALPCMANSPPCIAPGPGLSACAFEHLTKTFFQIRMVSHMGPATITQNYPLSVLLTPSLLPKSLFYPFLRGRFPQEIASHKQPLVVHITKWNPASQPFPSPPTG